jgi:two-component system, chemotaxis family, protein-glutamate methylesterase/glutaminase
LRARVPCKDIVVVGASAGGMEALQKLVSNFPPDLAASVFIVWHMAPGVKTVLPMVLEKAGPLPVRQPADGDPIQPGQIYVAANDHHLLIERGYVRVTKGPKENRFRPAVDPLFRSAAYVYGPRVVGVVLTGALDDGTAGLWTIKLRGGTAIVQEPAEALMRSMPLAALENVEVDYKLPVAHIGEVVGRLAREQAPPAPAIDPREQEKTENEIRIAQESDAMERHVMEHGELSPFTCPECHGVLTSIHEGKILRFRCHTGHAFSASTLLNSTTEQVEERLWEAVRALDETVMLLNSIGEEFANTGNTRAAERCFDQARDAHERSQPIREAAMRNRDLSLDETRDQAATG